jgi:acetoin utilization protein AcuB
MLVGERMKTPVITVRPDMSLIDALNLMKQEHIRRMPVVRDGKLVGIVAEKDLLNASPSPATSLSVYEMNYLLSKLQIKDVMTRNVLTVTEDTPIEEAARIMADNKIGSMPVVQDDRIVGIITETDLFKMLLELMGAREMGVRVTALLSDQRGKLAKLAQAVANEGGDFLAFGVFSGADPSNRMVTFKVRGIELEKLKSTLEPLVVKVIDIR